MKFTDGHWRMRTGVSPHYAKWVWDAKADGDSIDVFSMTVDQPDRNNLQDKSLITTRFSSPMEGVIRVRSFHHKGSAMPATGFDLAETEATGVRIEEAADEMTLTSGDLSVRIARNRGWQAVFSGAGRRLTAGEEQSMGYMDTPAGRFFMQQLSLDVGENVYGLGERFTAFVRNGQSVDIWNDDGGTLSHLAYKNVPFYITNRGYGIFVNHTGRVSFEVASENVERVQFSVPGESIEYYVIYGPTPLQIIEKYTALTGRPALPPAWSFGLWLSTSFTTNYDEKTVNGFIQGMAERDLPVHVFHFDCFWMRPFHWCDFEWDPAVFPDPRGMLGRLKKRGLHICVWINPYIAQRSRLFDEGAANGYLLKRPDGTVWQSDIWQAGMGIVDFTNPEARRWYCGKLRELLDMGVDSFKTDFGERIPTDVIYHDGSDPELMHNYYTKIYNETVFRLLEEERGQGQAALFARSATVGGQQFPVHWGGDCSATFVSMAESLRGGLSLGLGGFGFWSHDIGGFENTASADVYKRWCAFGLLSSHSRLHGWTSCRVPWLFDEEGEAGPDACDVLRFFTKLKCSLMPYLFRTALDAHRTGAPMMRAMFTEFPDDPGCDTLDRQYMLGSSLLAVPVLRADGVVDYYLPDGRWTNFLTGEEVEGGGWHREIHGYLSLPLMARPNSIIPVGADDIRPDYDYADGVVFHVFNLDDSVEVRVEIPDDKGGIAGSLTARRDGSRFQFTVEGPVRNWSVLLRNIGEAEAGDGGECRKDPLGTRVIPEAETARKHPGNAVVTATVTSNRFSIEQ